jgi:hypothetical protein
MTDLPRFQRDRALPSGGGTPGDELTRQLALLKEYVTSTADQVFSSHTRHIVDLTTYLETRTPTPHAPPPDLDLSTLTDPSDPSDPSDSSDPSDDTAAGPG